MSHRALSSSVPTTRRQFLAASGTAPVTAVTGCSAVAIGSDEADEQIAIRVGESVSDLFQTDR